MDTTQQIEPVARTSENGRTHEEEIGSEPFARRLRRSIRYGLAREPEDISAAECFRAVALTVRDDLVEEMLETERRQREAGEKSVHYLSLEYLPGRSLFHNLLNLGLLEECRAAVADLGFDLTDLLEEEPDAALGNGGLGRLAACFLDSMATHAVPGTGYGIHYEFGLFKQVIRDGRQQEQPDAWHGGRCPWLIERADQAIAVPLYGRIEHARDRNGSYNPMWMDWQMLVGVPYDAPVSGYGGETVNTLRLYAARASSEFDMEIFNAGDYVRAVEQKIHSEVVSKVLYPSDATERGRELRFVQEYFLVACTLRDILKGHPEAVDDPGSLSDRVAIHINETHPALVVAELMRVLVDERQVPWDTAWEITQGCVTYTNHTLMPEAFEQWPVELFRRVLPRHLQIVFEINRRLLDRVSRVWGGDVGALQRTSLIEEHGEQSVRMAHLAIAGSRRVNGVSRAHTALFRRSLPPEFGTLWRDRFVNVTNGISQRRWLLVANPALARLVTDAIGSGWITDLDELGQLEAWADDDGFVDALARVKKDARARLAETIYDVTYLRVDPDSLFDVHVKRIHEYKRQTLNALRIWADYTAFREEGRTPPVPKTYVFAGKAAPGYYAAHMIVRLVHAVGRIVNRDRDAREWMKVVFLPDYRVSLAERIVPAADLSEQISAVGTEASGTGNMKLALNGALTICSRDGANLELAEAVGADNIYEFGRSIGDAAVEGSGDDPPVQDDEETRRYLLESVVSGPLGTVDPEAAEWFHHHLVGEGDPYQLAADLGSYVQASRRAERDFSHRETWHRRALLNVARVGRFSSDRAIREYREKVWGAAYRKEPQT